MERSVCGLIFPKLLKGAHSRPIIHPTPLPPQDIRLNEVFVLCLVCCNCDMSLFLNQFD